MELVNFVLLFWVTSFVSSMAEAERYKRSQRTKACELLIVIDEPLYVTYGSKIDVITNLVKDHVDGLNRIYKRSFFKDHFSEYYFRAKNIEVLYDFCEECNHTQKVFLNEFSKYDSSAYCLAVLFTHRDFPQGIQGLAWRNTVCDDRFVNGHKCKSHLQDRSLISGTILPSSPSSTTMLKPPRLTL